MVESWVTQIIHALDRVDKKVVLRDDSAASPLEKSHLAQICIKQVLLRRAWHDTAVEVQDVIEPHRCLCGSQKKLATKGGEFSRVHFQQLN